MSCEKTDEDYYSIVVEGVSLLHFHILVPFSLGTIVFNGPLRFIWVITAVKRKEVNPSYIIPEHKILLLCIKSKRMSIFRLYF